MLSEYCSLVYKRVGSYVETARLLNFDRRTVKARVDAFRRREAHAFECFLFAVVRRLPQFQANRELGKTGRILDFQESPDSLEWLDRERKALVEDIAMSSALSIPSSV